MHDIAFALGALVLDRAALAYVFVVCGALAQILFFMCCGCVIDIDKVGYVGSTVAGAWVFVRNAQAGFEKVELVVGRSARLLFEQPLTWARVVWCGVVWCGVR